MVQGFSLIESIWPIGLHRLRLKTTICHRSTPPEPLPRCAFQTLAVADPPMLRSLSRLFMRRIVREPLSPQQTAQVAIAFSGLQVASGGGKGMKHGIYFWYFCSF